VRTKLKEKVDAVSILGFLSNMKGIYCHKAPTTLGMFVMDLTLIDLYLSFYQNLSLIPVTSSWTSKGYSRLPVGLGSLYPWT
jgi:hypothetical protein